MDSFTVKVEIKDAKSLYDKLKKSNEIGEENCKKLEKFCTVQNYKEMLEIAKKRGIKGFKWPTRGVNLKMLSRRVNEYLDEHKMTDKKDEEGLMKIMTERSWG